jgi:hypothetical protein
MQTNAEKIAVRPFFDGDDTTIRKITWNDGT